MAQNADQLAARDHRPDRRAAGGDHPRHHDHPEPQPGPGLPGRLRPGRRRARPQPGARRQLRQRRREVRKGLCAPGGGPHCHLPCHSKRAARVASCMQNVAGVAPAPEAGRVLSGPSSSSHARLRGGWLLLAAAVQEPALDGTLTAALLVQEQAPKTPALHRLSCPTATRFANRTAQALWPRRCRAVHDL